jgi:hypothetical protein
MVDLHPVTEEQVESADGPVGVIAEPEFAEIDLPNAEARLREAVEAGLFAQEAETQFDFLKYYDAADELLEAKQDLLAGQETLVRRIGAARPPLALREHVVLRRLRAEQY